MDAILVYIPMEEFNNLPSSDEKKQFIGNYLYRHVLRKIELDEQAKASA